MTTDNEPQRRRVALEDRVKHRQHSYLYDLPGADGRRIRVCKTMFLATLGYSNHASLIKYMRAKTHRSELRPAPKVAGGTTFKYNRDVSNVVYRSSNTFHSSLLSLLM